MKHFIIGTAGHIDHGKTSLIKAMTGIDADRLNEEKKRGITIELGFAHLDLPHFRQIGIVDVPGHEKFIKNMLAGAGGIDLVMMVIAADEGVMPQTREHLDILRLLNIQSGVIAVTKVDLVSEETLKRVEEQIRKEMAGTFLAHAPVVSVSSFTGQGIEELKNVLDEQLQTLGRKNEKKPFRLPVDRVFTMTGFGTVVTGTVIEGSIGLQQEAMLYPEEIPVKIRGIQVHSEPVTRAFAGQRTAINLAGITKEEIQRGNVLAPVGSMNPTRILDVRLDILKSSPYPVKNNSKVHVYHGSAQLVAKVVLVDREELKAGESGYAQLRFQEKLAAKKGDPFVIRFFSPVITVGGGVILDAQAAKKKRNRSSVLEGMGVREYGSNKEQLYLTLLENPAAFFTLEELIWKGSLDKGTSRGDLKKLLEEERVILLGEERLISDVREQKLREYSLRFMKEYHEKNRLNPGMPLQEFRQRLLGEEQGHEADLLLAYWQDQQVLKSGNGLVSLYGFQIKKQEEDQRIQKRLEKLYFKAGYRIPVLETVSQEFPDRGRFGAVMTMMLKRGQLIRLNEKYMIHPKWMRKAQAALTEMGQNHGEIRLGDFRNRIGASRNIALLLLEKFDREGLTRKEGDVRFLY